MYTDASSLAAFFQTTYPLMTQGLTWMGDQGLFVDPAGVPWGTVDVAHQAIVFWDANGFTDRGMDTGGNVISISTLKTWGYTTAPFGFSSITDWISENPLVAIFGALTVYTVFLSHKMWKGK